MKIAITGHRPDKLGGDYDLTSALSIKIGIELIKIISEHKPTQMLSGMALGIDTLWAELALDSKVPLIAVVPFDGQETMWPKKSQERYEKILNLAEEVIYVSQPPYAAWKMQKRNEYLVDHCDILVAVWDGSEGGTANCYNYARKQDKTIIHINPKYL